ncbi:MAG TPA: cupredoxin domain-containing protein [Kofleriaceae bacterium]|nr:cupredoxin domain-containing protein [Kofleriaceae bacterium]
MSLRTAASGLLLALAAAATSAGGCKKQDETAASKPVPAPAAAATATSGAAGAATATATAAPDGVRKVPIDVVEQGYSPDRIPGKPGEKLTLVFTRKVDGHCYEELKTPDGKRIALPKGQPVEVAVTVPQQGEVKFTCGMDMLEGFIVAEKS